MSEKTILVWFRNDLRIHDNEILFEAVKKADKVLPVYCFDPYYFEKNANGNPKTGNFRARFLLESVACLRENLRGIGGELIIRVGRPMEILPQLALQYNVNEVYHHREVAHEETTVSEQVEAALWKIKLNLRHFIGHTLYHKEDLPFPIKDIPDSFAVFKKKVERDSNVRPCLPVPEIIKIPEINDPGELPTLIGLGLQEAYDDPRAQLLFTGGETAALAQLNNYLLQSNNAGGNKNNRGQSTVTGNTSKLSPWLAIGCISLRHVYWEVTKLQNLNNAQHTSQLKLDLLWRDYFRFMFKKHGQKFIDAKSVMNFGTEIINSDMLFENWKKGNTGIPIVDAIMHELNATGFINNYSRQIVAGYLVKDLKIDWKKGAAYFEEKLIDYSPASNWGNWAFIAGVNDAQVSKYNIPAKPVAELDTKGEYIQKWLPDSKEINYQSSSKKMALS